MAVVRAIYQGTAQYASVSDAIGADLWLQTCGGRRTIR